MGCPSTHYCIKCGGKCTGCSGCVIKDGLCPGCYAAKIRENAVQKQAEIDANKSADNKV